MMKLKFVDQDYQTDAVNSIVDIFEGAENKDSVFTIDISKSLTKEQLDLSGKGITYELGYANKLSLDDYELLTNVRKIQERNNILKITSLVSRNFSVEMETGTGKTYVYTKTILELNKKYGFTKFIIVVPSVAIKEGVFKSLQMTEEHFKFKYDNTPYSYFVYDSKKLNRIQNFSTNTNIEIMIINIDAFRKDMDDTKKSNIIHRESDQLSGNKPIDLISGTNPIVIIDEPQSVDNTPKAKAAIKSLKPLVTLRYSATHKNVYNLMYRLTPVDAYQQKLVKQIEVSSVLSDESNAKPYVKLISVDDKNGYKAKVEIWIKKKDGSLEKKKVTVKQGTDLWDASKEVDYYYNQGYQVSNIDCFEGEENIAFSNGEFLELGQAIGDTNDEAIKRAQIRETINLHLEKESHYIKQGIKVLSLFFIDKVENYRIYDVDGNQQKGKYAIWFEEEYKKLIETRYKFLIQKNKDYFSKFPEDLHDGYFSIDKKGRVKNSTTGSSKDDESTYELIMKDKEKLLDLNNDLRFIFSHSALKEGWDNPNVFQVCTLVDTKDTMTKRQKIGRGLRICVNQKGERVLEPKYNKLSVVANEAYKSFASSLQRELEREAGYKFGIIEAMSFVNLQMTTSDGEDKTLNQNDSQTIYNYLKEQNYINKQGKVTEKYYKDKANDTFVLPYEYVDMTDKITFQIENLAREIEIKNVENKIKVNIVKEVIESEEFKKLFNKIKQKTFYDVEIDIDAFVQQAAKEIRTMPKIQSEKVIRERSRLDITAKGVLHEDRARYEVLGSISDFETIKKPDLLRRLQESTGLLRKTLADILIKSNRIAEFNLNPEVYLKNVSTIIKRVKKEFMVQGIKYHKTDEYYTMDEVFDTELSGYKDKNIFKVDLSKKNNVYDYVIFDSNVEKMFAEDADKDENVIVYAKLPTKYFIHTPYGKYSPDWIVLMRSTEGDKLYFVAETKSTKDKDKLHPYESAKIMSGKIHFESLNNGLEFKHVVNFKDLK